MDGTLRTKLLFSLCPGVVGAMFQKGVCWGKREDWIRALRGLKCLYLMVPETEAFQPRSDIIIGRFVRKRDQTAAGSMPRGEGVGTLGKAHQCRDWHGSSGKTALPGQHPRCQSLSGCVDMGGQELKTVPRE